MSSTKRALILEQLVGSKRGICYIKCLWIINASVFFTGWQDMRQHRVSIRDVSHAVEDMLDNGLSLSLSLSGGHCVKRGS